MKTYLLVFLFFCSLLGFGQSVLDKGNYQLAGGVSFNVTKSKNDSFNDKSAMFEFAPQYSYFVVNNLMVGALVSFKYSTYEWLDSTMDKFVRRSVGFGPNIKYYFRSEKIIPFVSSSAIYEKYFKSDEYGYTVDFSAGFDMFLAKSVAIEPFVSYNFNNNYDPISSQTIFSFGVRFNYFIVK
jgi:hypothetical protein